MDLKNLLDKFDLKNLTFNKKYEGKNFIENISNNDLENTTVTYNIDNIKIIYIRYVLAYYYNKGIKLKYIWSWSDINMNSNNNNNIITLFNKGIKLDIKDNFIDNIKYYIVNNNFYINKYELDIIIAYSMHNLNCDSHQIELIDEKKNLYIIYLYKLLK